MELIIVESPTKAKTLSKFLGKDYEVEATMGHIKDLPKSKLGIDVEHNFKPLYTEMPTKEETIKTLKKIAKKAKKIYIATDPDREGEAIAEHVKEVIDTDSKTSRITFHEITQEAVVDAIAHPRKIDLNLVDAQIARRVLDRLVGYKLSPLLWKKVRRGLSAGRVQTVAVRLIVEREKEIEKFKPDEYWEIASEVSTTKKEKFIVNLTKTDVKNKKEADKIVSDLNKAKYIVSEVKKREVKKNPYAPFTTSTMTQTAARLYGFSAKRTMRAAQGLYEEGLITYHRTDSTNIAQIAITKVREFIKKEYGDKYLPVSPRIYKTKSKVAQEAHEAIRPTNMGPMKNDLTGDTKKLYELIWRRFIACQMATSIYDETTIDVKADDYLLRASGQIMKFDGWRKVLPLKQTEEEVIALPEVQKDDKLDLIKVLSDQKFTQPPPRFNEASIIKTLEKLGIGRPSTYAPIISTIQLRSYVEKKEGKFFPTPVGMAVNDFLMEYFPDVFDYAFTASMEDNLDKVANGEKKWETEIKNFYTPFDKKLETVTEKSQRVKIPTEKLGRKCPDCKDGELVIRIGRFGKFISCSNFPECKHTEKYLEKIDMKCPKCKEGDVIVKKTGKGRAFYGCSRYPDCDFASWKNPKLPAKKKEQVNV
jgi:DNA topoisomerase-1